LASSRRKKRPARVLFAAILLIVFYFLLFPYPLGKELVARPRWAVPVSAAGATSERGAVAEAGASAVTDPPAAVSAWQLGNRFGFVREDGQLLYSATAACAVALSSSGFVSFTRMGTDWVLQDPEGRRVAAFAVSGYPLLSSDGGRIFSVKTDLSGLTELDRGGNALWDRDFPTVITAVSVAGDLVAVGLVNGNLVLLNRGGGAVLEHAPGGSRVMVIAGVAAAADGSRIAAVSGIDPQYLVVLGKSGGGYEPVASNLLPTDFRREVRMGFSPDSRWLFVEGPSGPGLFDAEGSVLRWVNLPGALGAVSTALGGRVAAFASRQPEGLSIVLEPPRGIPVGREAVSARQVFLGTIGRQLLMGWDDMLARIDVEEM